MPDRRRGDKRLSDAGPAGQARLLATVKRADRLQVAEQCEASEHHGRRLVARPDRFSDSVVRSGHGVGDAAG